MNITNVLKLIFSQIYNRRYMFFLSLLTIGVIFFYLDYMTYQSFEQYYQIWKAKETLADKGKNVYSLKFDDINFVETNEEKAKEFFEKVKEKCGTAGGFYVTSVNMEQLAPMDLGQLEWEELAMMEEEEWQKITQDMLIIDENIAGLCDCLLENGEPVGKVNLKKAENIPVFMGSNYKDRVKQGDVLTTYLTDDTYEVAGFFAQGTEWITDSLFFTTESAIPLDNCLLVFSDKEFEGVELQMSGRNFYILSDMGKDKLDKEIQSIAEVMDISVSISSFEDLALEYKKENAEAMRLAKIILFTGLIVVALTSVLNSVMTVIARKKEYIVMNVCGVSYRDIFKMICMENIIKMVIPFEFAILLMNQISYYHNKYRSDNYMYIQNKAVLVMLFYMLCLLVLCSMASVRYLKRTDINKVGGMFDD